MTRFFETWTSLFHPLRNAFDSVFGSRKDHDDHKGDNDHKDDDTDNGGGGNAPIYGDRNDNEIQGTEGNDRIYARRGDDFIEPGRDSDFIDGGRGTDTVRFDGSLIDYDVDTGGPAWGFSGWGWGHWGGHHAQKVVVTDLADGSTNTLKSVEVLEFDDAFYYLDGRDNPIVYKEAPAVANDDSVATNEDSLVPIYLADLLANDIGANGAAPVVTAIAGVDLANLAVGEEIALDSGARLVRETEDKFSYDPNGSFEEFGPGQQAADSFAYEIIDANGNTATAQVAVAVDGINDLPVGLPVIAGVTQQGEPLTASALSVTDAEGLPGPIAYQWEAWNGTAWMAIAGAAAAEFVPTEAHVGQQLRVRASYADGGGTEETVVSEPTDAVSGGGGSAPLARPDINANDPVVEAGLDPTTGDPSDGDAIAEGNVLDNDDGNGKMVVGVVAGPAAGAQSGGVGDTIAGTFGALVLNASGEWTYELDNDKAATQALVEGNDGSDVFTYTMADANGVTSTTTLIITIAGRDDPAPPVPPRAIADINVDDAIIEASTDANGNPVGGDATAAGNVLDNDEGVGTSVIGVAAGPGLAPLNDGVGSEIQGTYGAFTLGADGNWIYLLDDTNPATNALAEGQKATDVFTYTMQDASGQTSTTTVFIIVDGADDEVVVINNPPVANNDDVTVTSTTEPVIINVLANDSDIDGDPLTITFDPASLPNGVTAELLDIDQDGFAESIQLVPVAGAGFPAAFGFQYEIRDGRGGIDTATVTVTVENDPNNPPTAIADTNDGDPVIENGIDPIFGTPIDGDPEAVGNVLANDTDPDTNDTKMVVGVTFGATTDEQTSGVGNQINGTYGWLTLNADGTWKYVLDDGRSATDALGHDQQATEVFTYTMADAAGARSSTTLSVVVTGSADEFSGSPIGPVTDADATGNTIVENAPEGALVGITASAIDPDSGDVVSYEVDNPRFTIDATGVVMVAAGAVFDAQNEPQVLVRVIATSSDGSTSVAQFEIDITPDIVNNPPQVSLTPLLTSLPENTDTTAASSKVADIVITDDGIGDNQLTLVGDDAGLFEIVQTTNGPELHLREGAVLNFQDNPILDVTVEVDDATIDPTPDDAEPFSLAITEVSGAPEIVAPASATTDEDTLLTFSSGNGNPVSVAGVDPVAVLTLTIAALNGEVSINPNVDTDGDAIPDILDNDDDGDGTPDMHPDVGPSITIVGTLAEINVQLEGMTYTPNPDENGADTITYVLADVTGTPLDSKEVPVTVNPVNDDSVANDDTASTAQGTGVLIDVLGNDTDVDGDEIFITAFAGTGNAVLNPRDENGDGFLDALEYIPTATFSGIDTFTYEISDGNGGTDSATVTVNVAGPNQEPAGTDDTVVTDEDAPYVFAATDFGFNDPNNTPENNLAAVRVTTVPTVGLLSLGGTAVTAGNLVSIADINAGLLVFTPDLNANGDAYATFTFQVQDDGGTDNGGTDLDATPNTLTIDVTPVNDDPVASDDTASTSQGTGVLIDVLDNDIDVDGDQLEVADVTGALGGTLSVIDSDVDGFADSIDYAPNVGFTGTDTFTYTISDGNGGTATATVTVNVAGPNQEPAGTDGTVVTDEDAPYVFAATDFGFNDPNNTPENNLAAVTVTTVPTAGLLSLGGTAVTAGNFVSVADINAGLLVFTPAANANGASYASFTFQVQDDGGTDNGGTDLDATPNTLTIDVTPVNDAPQLAEIQPLVSAQEDGAPVTAIFGADDVDSDDDQTTLTYVPALVAGNGTVINNNNGTFTFDPGTDFRDLAEGQVGNASFEYTATDKHGASTTLTQAISVVGSNDAPHGAAVQPLVFAQEDGTPVTAIFGADDVDSDDDQTTLNYDVTAQPAEGSVSNNNDGTFTFDPGTDFQDLAEGEVRNVSFEYTATDGHDASTTLTQGISVVGVNNDLIVDTLDDEAYDNGTLADELADGGGLSLREAVGLINAGQIGSTEITFDSSVAGGQIDINGNLIISADMSIDGGAAGMTIAGDNLNRVFTIDGAGTSASLNALTITGGGGVGIGGGVRVFAGAEVSISNSLIVDNNAFQLGDAIMVDAGAAATLTNTTVTGHAVGNASFAVESEGNLTLINATISGNAQGVRISGGTATTTNSIVLGNQSGGAPDFVNAGGGATFIFNGLSIIGTGNDDDPGDGKIDGVPEQIFADIDPSTGGGVLADNGGPTQTIALLDDAGNPAIDAAIGGTDTDQRGESAHDAIAGTGDTGNNRDLGAYEVQPPANEAPVLAGPDVSTSLVYSENDPAIAVAATLTVDDADDTNIDGATVALAGYVSGEDLLEFNNEGSTINGTFDNVNGILTLAGSATLAEYQTVLRSVTYVNTSEDPSAATRTLSITVNDGTDNSNTVTRDVIVTPVNDAPAAGNDSGSGAAATPVTIDVLLNDTDVEDGTPDPATVDIDPVSPGIQTTLAATGEGVWTVDQVTGAITFTPDPGFEGQADITYTVDDSEGKTSNPATVSVTIDPAAAAPEDLTIVGSTVIADEAGAAVGELSATDADGNLIEGAVFTVVDTNSDFVVVDNVLQLKETALLAAGTTATTVEVAATVGTETITEVVDVTVLAAAQTSFVAASANFETDAIVLDLNADGFADLMLRGSAAVVFGSTTGLQAASEAEILAGDGSSGFVINVEADALTGADFNSDGVDDLAVGSLTDATAYVVFGSAAGLGASVDVGDLDGTTGFAVTGLQEVPGNGTATINMSVGDVNGDLLEDLVINHVVTNATGTQTTSTTYVVYGDEEAFAPSIDVSGLNGANGFKLINTADAVSGGSLAVADIDGDQIDDIILGTPITGGVAGKVYAVKGRSTFAATTDIGALTAGVQLLAISNADAADFGTTVSAVGDVTGDGVEDLTATTAAGEAYILDGAELRAAAAAQADVSLTAADATLTGASGRVTRAGDINGDGVDDLFAVDAAGNSFVIHGRADLLSAPEALELAQAAELDGFVIAGTAGRPLRLGDADGDGFEDFMIVDPNGLRLASGADFTGEADFVAGVDGVEDFVGDEIGEVIIGSQNANNLSGNGGSDHILGGAGPDTLNGGVGNDGLEGGGGDDNLSGGSENDVLIGGHGNDVLNGGSGFDRAEGGPGADTFVFAPGDGRLDIVDFHPGPAGIGDRIDLSGFNGGGGPGLSFEVLDTNMDGVLTPDDNTVGVAPNGSGLSLGFGPPDNDPVDVLTIVHVSALMPMDLLFA